MHARRNQYDYCNVDKFHVSSSLIVNVIITKATGDWNVQEGGEVLEVTSTP